jgi:gluconolactonase
MGSKSFFYIALGIIFFDLSVLPQEPVLTDPELTLVDDGFQFVEGPVWKDGIGLLFSDIPANKIYFWKEGAGTSQYLNPSGNSNGLAVDDQGLVIMAQHGPRQVARLEADNSITPLATHFDGKRLNSPNDLVIRSDGSIFFTDPPYGLNDQGGTSELGFYGIYRLSPTGDVQLLDTSLSRPNGICFSPDESKLYVNDSETRRIYVWDIVDDTAVVNKQEFAYMQPAGYADGMKVDENGFLYVAGPIGIWIFDQEGNALDTIPVPGQTSNCVWGDDDRKTLYVTSGNAVYKISNKEDNPEALQSLPMKESIQFVSGYPNPFHISITIPLYIKSASVIMLEIFDLQGQKLETLLNRRLNEGNYATTWDAAEYSRGFYLVRASVDQSRYFSCLINKI